MKSRWEKCKLKRRSEYKHSIIIMVNTYDRLNGGEMVINRKVIRVYEY